MDENDTTLDVESAVRARYSAASREREALLCCPIDYDPQYLKVIPEEVIERDYGCGDPSRYVREGEVVLDLGSGGGKICFIASQIVGPTGRVIGVDMNDDMLALARRSAPVVGERVGWHNTEFLRGRIQDLTTDLDAMDRWLAEHPVTSTKDLAALEAFKAQSPKLIADGSVDVIVSNCVLNLVDDAAKPQLIREMFRVLKVGGRIAVSDIVSDEVVPQELRDDPVLWSGCISGAFQEQELLRLLEDAGFHGIAIDKYDEKPWQTVQGIEFRSVTVTAYKGKQGACWEANEAVIYKGPWKEVRDDDGHVFRRGERVAVCEKTFRLMTSAPYAGEIIPVPPRVAVPREEWKAFDCMRSVARHPRETKGMEYDATTEASDCCEPGKCC
ncbi:MAG: methyltransferase domain-containing protein [Myxococcota bacterium]